ncbi:hypothetical protein [Inconstantimicrobium mannanitabidum]|uniref:Membrane protein n=1 Tax=Inconstantimicrobium mannanitabidum TaxID=1604901 RepID=A0ACB5R9N1_9CLOT|nr:hypothetical protein [Clostridium sp. TW13]GKX65895.1 membrane protein [Clostridium sp. TW13]
MIEILQLLGNAIIETICLTGVIILIGFLLGILRNNSLKNFQRSFGSKAMMITGFIGVPIHELSHALLAIVFGHKIKEIKLLQKPDSNGVMGYVNHSFNKNNLYHQVGNFFIGIAPIFGGGLSIIALMYFIIPGAYNQYLHILIKNLQVKSFNKTIVKGILTSYGELIKTIFSAQNFKNPWFYLFLFLSICIASHISLSHADIKGASKGLGIMFLILLVLNVFDIAQFITAIDVMKYNIFITGILLIAVILSVVTFMLSLFFVLIKQR